jgi:hypothetical protein
VEATESENIPPLYSPTTSGLVTAEKSKGDKNKKKKKKK